MSLPNTNYYYIERKSSVVKSSKDLLNKKNDYKYVYSEIQKFAYKNNIKLPEKFNYYERYNKSLFLKVYNGVYKKKEVFLGVFRVNNKNK